MIVQIFHPDGDGSSASPLTQTVRQNSWPSGQQDSADSESHENRQHLGQMSRDHTRPHNVLTNISHDGGSH